MNDMHGLIPYVWLSIIILSAAVEFMIMSFVSVCFVPAALTAFVMSLAGSPIKTQAIVFIIITLTLMVLSRIFRKKILRFKSNLSDGGYMIGKPAIVVREINNLVAEGAVKVNGAEWDAGSLDDDVIYEVGQIVYVNKIEGARLICEK